MQCKLLDFFSVLQFCFLGTAGTVLASTVYKVTVVASAAHYSIDGYSEDGMRPWKRAVYSVGNPVFEGYDYHNVPKLVGNLTGSIFVRATADGGLETGRDIGWPSATGLFARFDRSYRDGWVSETGLEFRKASGCCVQSGEMSVTSQTGSIEQATDAIGYGWSNSGGSYVMWNGYTLRYDISSVRIEAVPVPASLSFVFLGGLALAVVRIRKKQE